MDSLLGKLLEQPSIYADFEFLAFWQTQYNNMNAVNLFFAWIKVRPSSTLKHYVGTLSGCGVISKDCCVFSSCPSRFSSTSVLIRLWLRCPPHWVDVLKISWDLPSCSSSCSLPTLSSDICSLGQRLTPSAPSSSACKRCPKQQRQQRFKKD